MTKRVLTGIATVCVLAGPACDAAGGKGDATGPDTPECRPECAGRECGDDGCGGSCGQCGNGRQCNGTTGTCEACTPACVGATCGDDGCGGTCGSCPETDVCNPLKRQCVAKCQPACDGKECGDDGCGGTCGSCPAGFDCNLGACSPAPQDVIAPGDDGPLPDLATPTDPGEGTDTGPRPDEAATDAPTADIPAVDVPAHDLAAGDLAAGDACVPDCSNRQCGDDGCGASCGDCPDGTVCVLAYESSRCEAPTPDIIVPADLVPTDLPTADLPTADLVPADVTDRTPPVVLSSDPANEATGVAIPFVVRVTFNEPIRFMETVDAGTFRLVDMYGKDVRGTLGYDDVTNTVTLTPDAGVILYRASPYRVVMSNLIQDKAGNRMVETTLRFSTTLGPDMSAYEDLAARFSPILYQSVSPTAPQFDYPTAFDFDNDWIGANNDGNFIKAQSIPAWVYYDVIETRSHYFLRYAYFYPRHVEDDNSFGNELSGALVVLAKLPEPSPIAVETYFGSQAAQDFRSFVTEESGLVRDGAAGDAANGNLNDKDRKYVGVNWVFPQDVLFPAGHYQAYLTRGTHESCAWVQTNSESVLDNRCMLNDGIKTTLSIVHLAYLDGTASELTKGEDGFPTATAEGDNVGYGLRSILGDWWVRRDRVGEMYGSSVPYQPPTDRPGANLELPTSFANTMEEAISFGRPPWAWSWSPTGLDGQFYYHSFPVGTIHLDPAYYFATRHRIPMTAGKDGFSSTYCFNPYLLIDLRGTDPDCPG